VSEIRNHVRQRDQVCVQCGGTDQLEVHHRIPLNDGGSNALDNLELRCKTCHTSAPAQP
jgi:5-methylcytosine-specific restriction endonuclease McrA